MRSDGYVIQTYCGSHFTVCALYQIITLYTLNSYNVICQLHLNKSWGVRFKDDMKVAKKCVI